MSKLSRQVIEAREARAAIVAVIVERQRLEMLAYLAREIEANRRMMLKDGRKSPQEGGR